LFSNSDDEHIAQVAAKRYQRYLREEEKKERHSKWVQDIITAILMLIKLITNTLQKANIKRKRVIERVSIE
jgi:septin family protein